MATGSGTLSKATDPIRRKGGGVERAETFHSERSPPSVPPKLRSAAYTGPQCKRRERERMGVPMPEAPGRETQEGGPAAAAGIRPRRGCSPLRAPQLPKDAAKPGRLSPPAPPPHAPRRLLHAARHSHPPRAHRACRACSLEPAVLLTACSASRRGLTRFHASAPQSAEGGKRAAHPKFPRQPIQRTPREPVAPPPARRPAVRRPGPSRRSLVLMPPPRGGAGKCAGAQPGAREPGVAPLPG